MKQFFVWLGTLVEDQAGSISSKRIGFFWCLWMLSRAVAQPNVNEVVVYAIVGLAFGLAGLTIPEWFATKSFDKSKIIDPPAVSQPTAASPSPTV